MELLLFKTYFKDKTKIYNYTKNNNELLVSEIINEIKYDERIIFRSILWLSKYGYMEIVRSNEKN